MRKRGHHSLAHWLCIIATRSREPWNPRGCNVAEAPVRFDSKACEEQPRGPEGGGGQCPRPWSTTHDRCSSTSTPESAETQLFLWLSLAVNTFSRFAQKRPLWRGSCKVTWSAHICNA